MTKVKRVDNVYCPLWREKNKGKLEKEPLPVSAGVSFLLTKQIP